MTLRMLPGALLTALLALCQGPTDPLARSAETVARAERELGPDDPRTGAALATHGRLLLRAGRAAEAEAALARALAIAEAAADQRLEATARIGLCGVLNQHGRHAEAADHAERGLSLRRQLLAADDPLLGEALNAAGSVVADAGDLDRGADLLREAAAFWRIRPDGAMRTAMALGNLASLQTRREHYDDALELLRQAIEQATAARGADDRTTLGMRANLGRLWIWVGRYEEARTELEPVIAAMTASLGADHPETIQAAAAMLPVLLAQQRHAEADALLQQLVPASTTRLGPAHPMTVALRTSQLTTTLEAGRVHQVLELADALRRELPDLPPSRRAALDLDCAAAQMRLGRPGEAVALVAQALPIAAQADATPGYLDLMRCRAAAILADAGEHRRAVELLQAALGAAGELQPAANLEAIRWRDLLARQLLAVGDAAGAIRVDAESLAGFAVALDGSLPSLLEEERLRRTAALRRSLDRFMAQTAADAGLLPIAQQFAAVLAWKSQVARGLEAGLAGVRRGGSPDARMRSDRLQHVVRSLGNLAQGHEPWDPARWRDLLAARERLLAELSNSVRGSATEADLDEALPAVVGGLTPDAALVEMVAWSSRPDTPVDRLSAFVVRGDGTAERVELGALEAVRRAVAAHLQLTARRRAPVDAAGTALADQAAGRLGQLLWQPLLPHLAGCTQIWIAPDEQVALVPFATLPGRPGRFLLEDFDLRYLRSGGELTMRPPEAGAGLLAVGGAADDLPGAAAEVAEVAALLRAAQPGAPCRVITAAEPGELAPAEAVAGVRWLHIAAHGRFLRGPAAAAGGAAHAAAIELPGGPLTVAAAALLDLGRCELAVLSACDTGIGDIVAGEHLLGMRRSLRLAGARRTLTAMWRIDDAATRGLMADFWQRVFAGEDPGAALRAAQLRQLATNRNGGDPRPGTWGAFLLEGH